MDLIVLHSTINQCPIVQIEEPYTTVPAKTPAQHRNSTICKIVLLSPKIAVAMATPHSDNTRTGFRPILSEARPQEIVNNICVNENIDSYKTVKSGFQMKLKPQLTISPL
jgi:hypothetical protein